MVRLDDIGKSYGTGAAVLSGVSLSLEPGDFCFLTGASGAGKTTLLKIITLAEPSSFGSLTLFDADPTVLDRGARAALRRRIGIALEDPRLIDELSVRDNVALPLRIAGAPERDIADHVPELLAWLGLRQGIEAYPASLSASEKQRVAIARAIVHRPELLVADEPIGRVDEETALFLVSVFERLNRLGTTVLIATRDRALARRFEHRRLHLERGVLASPADAEAQ